MQKIDAHQHFWKYHPDSHAWIGEEMKVIRKNFLPNDLEPLLIENNFSGSVAVQADQSEAETEFLLQLSNEYNFIKAVIGWVDFKSITIEERLEYFSGFEKLKGFRHIVQDEQQDDFLLRKDFCNGIALLEKYGFCYDILIYHKHLKYAVEFVNKFPNQPFIIDHLAKPPIKTKEINSWKKGIQNIAGFENVFCKISGLVTEADWNNYSVEDFKPYTDIVLEAFGTDRIIFGSDWPVCLPAASYNSCCKLTEALTSQLSENEKANFWGSNAEKFYNL